MRDGEARDGQVTGRSPFADTAVTFTGWSPGTLLAWASEQLQASGPVEVEVERLRAWSYSAALRADGRRVWVKANCCGFAHEGPVLRLLAEHCPGTAVEPLAVDVPRGWILIRDAGLTWAERGAATVAGYRRLFPAYANLQRELSPLAQAFVDAGAPDLRGDALADLLVAAVACARAEDVHGEHHVADDEAARLLAWEATVRELAEALAGSPVRPTLEHNDVHLGNVVGADVTFLDWGDSVVCHPFLGLANAVDFAADALQLAPALADLERSYFAAYQDAGEEQLLREDVERARVLAPLIRAHTWTRAPHEARRQYPAVLPDALRTFALRMGDYTASRG